VKYRTTCPQCASVFRLGPEQLEVAAGWVQCGVCGAPFDAYPALLQEDGAALQFPVESTPPVIPPPEAAAASGLIGTEVPAVEPTPELPPLEVSPVEAAAAAEAPPASAEPMDIAERGRTEELASIILLDPDQPADDDFGPLPVMPSPSMPPAYPPLGRAVSAAISAPKAVGIPALPRADDAPRPASGDGPEAELVPEPAAVAPVRRRSLTWAWATASLLLLATLVGQAAYFLRDTLAAELPQTRPALEQACALLGCTLELPRQVEQLRIVGSDLQTEATERLRLTLTLGNRSAQVQAWPVLVLTLTDQNNRPLARRSFAPSEYLGDPARIVAGIPPRTEHPLALPLGVRGIKPMGFDLRLTY
jgi:predicted Zn finger-like uncharacterized protein